jgi:hypothetical protein
LQQQGQNPSITYDDDNNNMTFKFKFKISETGAIIINLSVISIMVGALFTYHLLTWSLQHDELSKITQLASNPQTTLAEQKQLFADVRHILENQEKILQLQIQKQNPEVNYTNTNTTTK